MDAQNQKNLTERPDNFIGDCASTYLRSPRKMLNSIKMLEIQRKPEGGSKSNLIWLTDKGNIHDIQGPGVYEDDDSDLISSPKQRSANGAVMQKLAQIRKQNEKERAWNQKERAWNEKKVEGRRKSDPSLNSETSDSKELSDTLPESSGANQERISLPTKDLGSIADRAESWMGSEVARCLKQEEFSVSWMGSEVARCVKQEEFSVGSHESRDRKHGYAFHPPKAQSCLATQKLAESMHRNEEDHQINLQRVSPLTKHVDGQFEQVPSAACEVAGISKATVGTEKITLQRKDVAHMTERPNSWIGGETPGSPSLQSPKTKLRSSWMKAPEQPQMSVETRDTQTLHSPHNIRRGELSDTLPESSGADQEKRSLPRSFLGSIADGSGSWVGREGPHCLKVGEFCAGSHESKDGKNGYPFHPPKAQSPRATQKLAKFIHRSGEDHEINLQWVSPPTKHVDGQFEQVPSAACEVAGSSKATVGMEKITLQRKDVAHMTERPNSWIGGEPPDSPYLQSPKAKLRSSWIKGP